MRVLVTGAKGFIGKNLCVSLSSLDSIEIVEFTHESDDTNFDKLVESVDFIVHLAGVNRPKEESEFFKGNADLTQNICTAIEKTGRNIPVIYSSSIQAECMNPYGQSKLQAELHLLNLQMQTGNSIYIYRLPNVFGKWCRPDYNSVVATFCHNISHELPIQISDPDFVLQLVHVGDVISSFIDILLKRPSDQLFIDVSPLYEIRLGQLADLLYKFKESRNTLITEPVGEGLIRLLYATYISYISPVDFNYKIAKHEDQRGTFVEMLKTRDSGQFSFFTAHPGVTRGGHYHHVKTEKFLVIKGNARFGFRHILTDETYEIITSGDIPEIVETVPGWSHDITNIGSEEMLVMLWANEIFDHDHPDTLSFKV